MPMFQIERSLVGMTDLEKTAGSYRAINCADRFDGLTWMRSFVDEASARAVCYYEAPSREVLEAHQREAELQWSTITEVEEVTPASFAAGPVPTAAS